MKQSLHDGYGDILPIHTESGRVELVTCLRCGALLVNDIDSYLLHDEHHGGPAQLVDCGECGGRGRHGDWPVSAECAPCKGRGKVLP